MFPHRFLLIPVQGITRIPSTRWFFTNSVFVCKRSGAPFLCLCVCVSVLRKMWLSFKLQQVGCPQKGTDPCRCSFCFPFKATKTRNPPSEQTLTHMSQKWSTPPQQIVEILFDFKANNWSPLNKSPIGMEPDVLVFLFFFLTIFLGTVSSGFQQHADAKGTAVDSESHGWFWGSR